MGSISSFDPYLRNLEYFYSERAAELTIPDSAHSINSDGIEMIILSNDTDSCSKNQKYSTYFHRLNEEILDMLHAHRLVKKHHLSAPLTRSEIALDLVFAALGAAVPGMELIGKFGHHIPQLVHLIKDLGELGHHVAHFSHHGSENHYRISPELRGNQLEIFVNQLVGSLTYQFRYELSTLTTKECEELASEHYQRIKKCLEEIGTNEVTSATDIFEKILDLLDPNPEKVIEKLIRGYVEDRTNRIFRSNSLQRETFLNDFLANLQSATPECMLQKISTEISFKNDWHQDQAARTIAQENRNLSLSSVFVRQLTNCDDDNPSVFVSTDTPVTHVFNNPFWTAYLGTHPSLQETCKKIALVLIRSLTLEVVNSRFNQEQNDEMIHLICDFISPGYKLLNRRIVKLERKVDVLEKTLEQQQRATNSRIARLESLVRPDQNS